MYLPCEHFASPVDEVALDLIGRTLRVERAGNVIDALIIETEAYGGPDDPASHAAFKPKGGARIMWERAGVIYVFSAYGMYPCLNIVTGQQGRASAVLLRGALLDSGEIRVLGPGRVGRSLGVTLADNGLDCSGPVYRVSGTRHDFEIQRTARIGISRGTDTMWRFVATLD